MKKLFVKVLVIILINTLLTCGAVCICQFNNYANGVINSIGPYFSDSGDGIWDFSCIVMGIGAINGILLSKMFTKKEIKLFESDKKITKYRILTFVYNLALYMGTAAYVWFNEKEYKDSIDVSNIICLCSLIIISSVLCFSLYKYKTKRKFFKIIEKVISVISALFMVIAICCSLYLILPFNEFKYEYIILSDNEFKEQFNIKDSDVSGTNHVIITQNVFQDRRNMLDKDISFPDTIFGKEVEMIGGVAELIKIKNPKINIELPASIKFEALKYFGIMNENDKYIHDISKDSYIGNILLKGENPEYYIENNLAKKKDGSEIIFLVSKKYDLKTFNISKELRSIKLPNIVRLLFDYLEADTQINVDNKNPYFKTNNGEVLYSSTENFYDYLSHNTEVLKANEEFVRNNGNSIKSRCQYGNRRINCKKYEYICSPWFINL